jgi:BirA family biotin operon repressor/biotin-[acetyl-CoA-carboxylase] ligase
MDVLSGLALSGAPEGTIVVAGEQTAGRGRAGRSWQAPAGTSLLCSVLLRPDLAAVELSPLPLIAGLAIAEGIEALSIGLLDAGIELKWPNDIFIGQRKLAGVLMQSRVDSTGLSFVNLGIGINVNVKHEDLPPGATSLMAETGRHWSIDEVERSVLNALTSRYDQFIAEGCAPGLTAWEARSLYRGDVVRVERDCETLEGVLLGIGPNGALLLETANGTEQIVTGDLVRGPRPR